MPNYFNDTYLGGEFISVMLEPLISVLDECVFTDECIQFFVFFFNPCVAKAVLLQPSDGFIIAAHNSTFPWLFNSVYDVHTLYNLNNSTAADFSQVILLATKNNTFSSYLRVTVTTWSQSTLNPGF